MPRAASSPCVDRNPAPPRGSGPVVADDLAEAAAVVTDQSARRGTWSGRAQGPRSVAIEIADADEHDRQPPKPASQSVWPARMRLTSSCGRNVASRHGERGRFSSASASAGVSSTAPLGDSTSAITTWPGSPSTAGPRNLPAAAASAVSTAHPDVPAAAAPAPPMGGPPTTQRHSLRTRRRSRPTCPRPRSRPGHERPPTGGRASSRLCSAPLVEKQARAGEGARHLRGARGEGSPARRDRGQGVHHAR